MICDAEKRRHGDAVMERQEDPLRRHVQNVHSLRDLILHCSGRAIIFTNFPMMWS
jgi:hypothetical protein